MTLQLLGLFLLVGLISGVIGFAIGMAMGRKRIRSGNVYMPPLTSEQLLQAQREWWASKERLRPGPTKTVGTYIPKDQFDAPF